MKLYVLLIAWWLAAFLIGNKIAANKIFGRDSVEHADGYQSVTEGKEFSALTKDTTAINGTAGQTGTKILNGLSEVQSLVSELETQLQSLLKLETELQSLLELQTLALKNGADDSYRFTHDYWKHQLVAGIAAFSGRNILRVYPSDLSPFKLVGQPFSLVFAIFLHGHDHGRPSCVVWKGETNKDRTPSIWILPETRRLSFRISSTTHREVWGTSNQALPLHMWTHVALVSDGLGSLQLFLDGQLDTEVPVLGAVLSNEGPVLLGGDGNGPGFSGLMTQIAFLPSALSKADVKNEAALALADIPRFELLAARFMGGAAQGPRSEVASRADGSLTGGNGDEGEVNALGTRGETAEELFARARELEEAAWEEGALWGGRDGGSGGAMEDAVELYEQAAARGHASAHMALGVHFGGGLFRRGGADDSRALFHILMAAVLGGDAASKLALGWRHLAGAGVARCDRTAMWYYERVARAAYGRIKSPEDAVVLRHSIRLSESTRATLADELEGEASGAMQALRWQAGRGDSASAAVLAQRYLEGSWGMPRDPVAAERFFRIAHGRGDPHGALGLARMHLFGEGGLPVNHSLAYAYYSAATESPHTSAEAMAGLGFLHFHGHGTEQNHTRALELFSRSAAQGSVVALANIGVMLRHGYLGEQRPDLAVVYFRLATEQGHLPAAFQLAVALSQGAGVSPSLREAANLFRMVAEVGPWAQLPLERGLRAFIAGRLPTALAQYQQLAEMGYPVALYNVAWILQSQLDSTHAHGGSALSVRTKYQQRIVDHIGSGASERIWALLRLGDCHYYGRGCEVDTVAALSHYRAAAKLDDPEALFNVAYMVEHGLGGVPCDLVYAEKSYMRVWRSGKAGREAALLALLHLRAERWWRRVQELWKRGLEEVHGSTQWRRHGDGGDRERRVFPSRRKEGGSSKVEDEGVVYVDEFQNRSPATEEFDWESFVDVVGGFVIGVLTVFFYWLWKWRLFLMRAPPVPS